MHQVISGLAWMHSNILATAVPNREGTLRLFHARSDDECHRTLTGCPVSGLCWSNQWGLIVSHDDRDGTWELWQNDIQKKIAEYPGHSQGILNIAANPRGDMVASVSSDRTLKLRQLSQSVTPVQSPMGNGTPTKSPMQRDSAGPHHMSFLR
jgi:WD40 repeat protein